MAAHKMTFDQASTLLAQDVGVRTFFTKMAGYGFVPTTEEEAQEFLALGRDCLTLYRQDMAKTAAAGPSEVAAARRELIGAVSGDRGQGYDEATRSRAIKQAAAAAVQQRPDYVEAANIFAEHLVNAAAG